MFLFHTNSGCCDGLIKEKCIFILCQCIIILCGPIYIYNNFGFRQLCVLLNAEEIYKSIAKILKTETDLKFARVMVDTLNTILLTSSELLNLRNRLKTEVIFFFSGLFQFFFFIILISQFILLFLIMYSIFLLLISKINCNKTLFIYLFFSGK